MLVCATLASGCSREGDGAETTLPPRTTVGSSTTEKGFGWENQSTMRDIEMLPVIQVGKMADPTETTPKDGLLFDGKGKVYSVGAPLASGNLVFSAGVVAASSAGPYKVYVTLSGNLSDEEAVTDAIATCKEKGATCPSGMVAFISDGVFVTAALVSDPPSGGVLEIGSFESRAEADLLAQHLSPR